MPRRLSHLLTRTSSTQTHMRWLKFSQHPSSMSHSLFVAILAHIHGPCMESSWNNHRSNTAVPCVFGHCKYGSACSRLACPLSHTGCQVPSSSRVWRVLFSGAADPWAEPNKSQLSRLEAGARATINIIDRTLGDLTGDGCWDCLYEQGIVVRRTSGARAWFAGDVFAALA